MIQRVFFTAALFFSFIMLNAPAVLADELGDAWFRQVVGTWKVDGAKGGAEIAIWERQVLPEAPSNSAFLFYYGIVRTFDGACAFTFDGQRNGVAGEYPREQIAEDVHLRAYFGVPVDPGEWITQFTDPNDPKPMWNRRDPSAQVKWAQRVSDRQRSCSDRISKFFLYPKSENGPWVAEETFGLWKTDGRSGKQIEKVAASAVMLSLIANEKKQKLGIPRLRAELPSDRDIAVIQNPSVYAGTAPSINSQCNQKRHAAGYRLARATGFVKLEARAVDDNMVAVTQHKPKIVAQGRPAKEVAYYPKNGGVDWNALSLVGEQGGDPDAVCRAADALDAFLKLRESQPTLPAPGGLKGLDTYNGLYMVDRHGVGRVVISQTFAGANYVERVFGSSGKFKPGDRTHIVRETPASGTMTVISNVKDVVTGEVTPSGGIAPDTIRIARNQEASDWLKVDAYVGEIEPREDTICIAWKREKSSSGCSKRATSAKRTKQTYFVKEKDVAIRTFKNMSPNPDTWTRTLDADDCMSGPFCGPGGSQLLRAIYLGDDASVRRLETDLIQNTTKVLKDYFKRLGAEDARISVLPRLINEYMYDYQNRPEACLAPGAQEMIFERSTNEIVYENGFGMETFKIDSMDLYGRYVINEEFVEICREVCDVREAALVSNVISNMFEGPDYGRQVGKMLSFAQNNACGLPAVKQFEHNFIDIFKTSLAPLFDGYYRYELSWY